MADIPQLLRSWSATASNNQPTGATPISTGLDDNLRTTQATIRQFLASPGSTIASASTVDLSTADGRTIPISGTSTVTGLGTESAGIEYLLAIGNTQTWKNSTALPLGTDQVFVAGDIVWAKSEGAGLWTFPGIQRKNSLVDNIFKILGSDGLGKSLSFDAHTFMSTAQAVTLFSPNASGIIATTTDPNGRVILPAFHIQGFGLTSGTTTYDIAAGQAIDSTNVVNILGSAMPGKTQAAWSAGSSAGGKLQATAMANATWYNWFAIKKDADASVDYGFDSSVVPTMPSGYTYYRYIGARKTQAASTNWESMVQHGDEVFWATPPALDVNGSISTGARALTTMNIPPGYKLKWFGNAQQSNPGVTDTGLFFTDPACADVATGIQVSPLGSIVITASVSGTFRVGNQVTCWTNASAQVGIQAKTAATCYVQTLGWMDPRGKPV